jgi:hypothetical protein
VQFQRDMPPHRQQWQARNALLRKLTRSGLAQAG